MNKPPRWLCDNTGDETHVWPLDDERPHKPQPSCPCRPKMNEWGVWIHDAWDRREVLEQVGQPAVDE